MGADDLADQPGRGLGGKATAEGGQGRVILLPISATRHALGGELGGALHVSQPQQGVKQVRRLPPATGLPAAPGVLGPLGADGAGQALGLPPTGVTGVGAGRLPALDQVAQRREADP